MAIKEFMKNYETVIFDMDGVMTSEQNYWNSAALTVYEFLNSREFFGNQNIDVSWCLKNVAKIRSEIFFDDNIIITLKERGVNSNWDLAYLTICLKLILPSKPTSKDCFDYINETFSDNILDDYDRIADQAQAVLHVDTTRQSDFWRSICDVFQHWFLGDELYFETNKKANHNSGRIGFLNEEKPIIDKDLLREIMRDLFENGVRLGIATGRPRSEMQVPLKLFGIDQFMAPKHKISYTHIKSAEDRFEGKYSLTKPHPYIFLKALYGEDCSDGDIVAENYDKSMIEKTLVVGDAGADILAAQCMGADFLAVLTGVSGKKARAYFEGLGSTYILDSLEELIIWN